MNQHDDQNGEEPTPKPQVPEQELLSEEELAEMTGFKNESAELDFAVKETAFVPSSITSTKRDVFALSARTTIIAFASLGIVLTITLGGQIFTTIFSNQRASRPVAQKPTPVQKKDSEDDIASLKTKIALTDQRALILQQTAQLRKLNNKVVSASALSIPSATPTVKSTSVPPANTTESEPTPVTKVVTVTVPTATAPKYELTQQIPKISPPRPEKQIIFKPAQKISVPVKPTQPKSLNPPTPSVKLKRQVQSTEGIFTKNDDSPNIEQSKSTNKTKKNKPKAPEIASSIVSNNVQTVIVGSRALAELKNTISWSANGTKTENSQVSTGSKSNKSNQYYIRLMQNLENPDGKIVLAKGTLLITQLKSITAQGWVNLSVVSIFSRTESGVIEKPVPLGAILVQKKDGSPLKVQITNNPQNENDADTNTSIYISKTARLPVRHGIDPIHNESARKLDNQRLNNFKTDAKSVGTPIFRLEKNTALQIYINRSFSL